MLNNLLKILWDDESGTWFDYDFKNSIKRPSFYASNFSRNFQNFQIL
jgi:neutral trehalase